MSWGYKLMVTFIVFAAMMGYMVYRCYGTNFELVEKEYYKSELKYQDVIDGSNNASALRTGPELTQTANDILLQMPDEMKNNPLSGSVLFYCAYNSKNDKTFSLGVDKNGVQSFGHAVLPGKYIVKIDWTNNGRKYYAEKKLTIL
ncbi:MAG: FixH family protein [Chitinophagaceae bacterium]